MIKACIFDLDGVIVDTAKYHYVAWKKLAKEFNYDLTEEKNELLKGVGRMESLDLILDWANVQKSEEERNQMAALKNEWYKALLVDMNPNEILDGALSFLNHLQDAKIPFALGSASKNAMTILEKIGLVDYFDAIIDGTKTTKSKPDPQVFQLGAAALNVTPQECVVFEDSSKGIEAALNGGFYAVGIGKPSNLAEAHLVIPDFKGWTIQQLNESLKK